MTLAERMHAYLKRHEGEWISKRHLSQLAQSRGYSYEATTEAFEELNGYVDVGGQYDQGYWYRWYPLTEDEKRRQRDILAFYDSMPEWNPAH